MMSSESSSTSRVTRSSRSGKRSISDLAVAKITTVNNNSQEKRLLSTAIDQTKDDRTVLAASSSKTLSEKLIEPKRVDEASDSTVLSKRKAPPTENGNDAADKYLEDRKRKLEDKKKIRDALKEVQKVRRQFKEKLEKKEKEFREKISKLKEDKKEAVREAEITARKVWKERLAKSRENESAVIKQLAGANRTIKKLEKKSKSNDEILEKKEAVMKELSSKFASVEDEEKNLEKKDATIEKLNTKVTSTENKVGKLMTELKLKKDTIKINEGTISELTKRAKAAEKRIKELEAPPPISVVKAKWQRNFESVKAFKEEHGHFRVPDGPLQSWISRQQRGYKNTLRNNKDDFQLTMEQIGKLQTIQFEWDTESKDSIAWETNYKKMLEFRLKNNHCKVPRDNPLYHWVVHQRRKKVKNSKLTGDEKKVKLLTEERIKRLDQLGFIWNAISDYCSSNLDENMEENEVENYEQLWEKRFQQLLAYHEENGHCKVSRDDDKGLCEWVGRQRQKYNKDRADGTNVLKPDQVRRMSELGMDWNRQISSLVEHTWEQRFRELIAYKEEHGDCRVPYLYSGNMPLGKWVAAQRKRYKELQVGQLSDKSAFNEEKMRRLEEIGFEWKLVHRRWRKRPEGFEESPQPSSAKKAKIEKEHAEALVDIIEQSTPLNHNDASNQNTLLSGNDASNQSASLLSGDASNQSALLSSNDASNFLATYNGMFGSVQNI